MKGNRTNSLNRIVYAAVLRGGTDHSAPRAAAIESGLPPAKVDITIQKAIEDAEAKTAATFDRKDATVHWRKSSSGMGWQVRYNLRSIALRLVARRRSHLGQHDRPR